MNNIEDFAFPIEENISDYSLFLGSLVKFMRRKTIVEIGVAFGHTTYTLCKASKQHDGSNYTFEQIKQMEKDWYNSEINKYSNTIW